MRILVVGSGLAGLSASVTACESGADVLLVSPLASERAQSVMAAGGLNAAFVSGEGDSPEVHAKDTMKSGAHIADEQSVLGLCRGAVDIVEWLEESGTVFTRHNDGSPERRMMAGQSFARTVFAGACTGKQFVSAMVRCARKYEASGRLVRRTGSRFIKMLMNESSCCGGIFYDELKNEVYYEKADSTILCTGGMNLLFGKTTGSALCDGSAAAAVFMQGARLKNLEMIQYHPTTIVTPQKQMLITEAARGEGGRLFYNDDNGQRIYFMEEKYGEKGNLQTRDVVSREIFATGRQVYLDLTFFDKDFFFERLSEVYEVCMDYLGLDPTREPIPVSPCAHYFMGGISVGRGHQTTVDGLFAAGECASIYHGANRLGGNSMLGALYGGKVAALSAMSHIGADVSDAESQTDICRSELFASSSSDSSFPSIYILHSINETMGKNLGIIRSEAALSDGLFDLEQTAEMVKKIKFDLSDSPFHNYAIKSQVMLAYAIMLSAMERKESRGAHFRSDYPKSNDDFCKASYASFNDGNNIKISFEKDEGQA